MYDCRTGLELEVVLPEGRDRFTLLDALAKAVGGEVEPFQFVSKVPMPQVRAEDLAASDIAPTPAALSKATTMVVGDIAKRHHAKIVGLSPDRRFFYLGHRAGRVVDGDGRTVLSVVHDNTLVGGERVAEIVTAPFTRSEISQVRTCVEVARDLGSTAPPGAGLHVHVDATDLLSAAALHHLVRLWRGQKSSLLAWMGTSDAFLRAAELPERIEEELLQLELRDAPLGDVRSALRSLVPHRGFGLNLYNIAHDVEDKNTVELKPIRASLDADHVVRVREGFVALVAQALKEATTGRFSTRTSD